MLVASVLLVSIGNVSLGQVPEAEFGATTLAEVVAIIRETSQTSVELPPSIANRLIVARWRRSPAPGLLAGIADSLSLRLTRLKGEGDLFRLEVPNEVPANVASGRAQIEAHLRRILGDVEPRWGKSSAENKEYISAKREELGHEDPNSIRRQELNRIIENVARLDNDSERLVIGVLQRENLSVVAAGYGSRLDHSVAKKLDPRQHPLLATLCSQLREEGQFEEGAQIYLRPLPEGLFGLRLCVDLVGPSNVSTLGSLTVFRSEAAYAQPTLPDQFQTVVDVGPVLPDLKYNVLAKTADRLDANLVSWWPTNSIHWPGLGPKVSLRDLSRRAVLDGNSSDRWPQISFGRGVADGWIRTFERNRGAPSQRIDWTNSLQGLKVGFSRQMTAEEIGKWARGLSSRQAETLVGVDFEVGGLPSQVRELCKAAPILRSLALSDSLVTSFEGGGAIEKSIGRYSPSLTKATLDCLRGDRTLWEVLPTLWHPSLDRQISSWSLAIGSGRDPQQLTLTIKRPNGSPVKAMVIPYR